MLHKDAQLGKPHTVYKAPQITLESYSTSGMLAYATDREAMGYRDNEEWVWLDSVGGGGSGGVIFSQSINQTVNLTTEETTLIGPGRGTRLFDPDQILHGDVIRYELGGYVSRGTLASTLDIAVKLGGTELYSTGPQDIIRKDNMQWILKGVIVRLTAADIAQFTGNGLFVYNNGLHLDLLNTSSVPIDTTNELLFDATVTWGISTLGNIIRTTYAVVEHLTNEFLAPVSPSALVLSETI